MRSPAQQARENAISFEVKKDGLQQRQSGDWVLRVTVQPLDMHQVILNAPMGTRFACVLVEVNDDETPVDHRAQQRDKWQALGPAQQAGMRCKEPVFWAFLEDKKFFENIHDEAQAAIAVRGICGVPSRSELNKVHQTQARLKWHDLDNEFQGWKVAEHG
jgi:hypothetical protein